MLSLLPFKNKAKGVNDLLNWAALIDGSLAGHSGDEASIVQCKDGGLAAGWWYRGPDLGSATAEEHNSLTVRVNAALAKFSGGWAVWISADRTEAEGYPAAELSHFPDEVSRMLDNERRKQFEAEGEHLENDYTIVVHFTPPLRRNNRILDIIYDEDRDEKQSPADRILEQFQKDLAAVEDAIGDSVFLRRMRSFKLHDDDGTEFLSDELVNYCHYALNGQKGVALKIPDTGAYLDTVIGLQDLWTSDTPLYGDHFIAVVGIQGFPESSFPQILASLDHLEIPYRWVTRFIFMDLHESVRELHKYHRKWKQRIRGFFAQVFKTNTGTVNEDALLMTQQAQEAIAVANSGKATYGYHTPVVVLRHPDHQVLMDRARLVSRAILRLGFATRIESFNAMEAWLGSLPGHPIPNVRRPPEHTDNLSNLIPLTSIWAGSDVHPNPLYPPNSPALFYATAIGKTPFRTSLHFADGGNSLLFGPKGSGKSSDLCLFAWSQFRYPGARVWVLDKGRSMKTLCQALGGLHYEILGADSPQFCPLEDLETYQERAEAVDWVATCFELQHQRAPLPHHLDGIYRAIELLAERHVTPVRNMSAAVQDQEVREAMHYYSLLGPMGHLYDGRRDGLSDHRFVVLEIGDLLSLRPMASVPAFLHIIRKFKRLLTGHPSMLFIDEAHMVFDREFLTEKLREILKEFRKLVCGLIMATQSLADAYRTALFALLVEATDYKIMLPNPEANTEGRGEHPGPRDLYTAMGFNDVEIDIIRHSTPKRDAYIRSPEGRRLIRINMSQAERALCCVSAPEDLDRVAKCQQRYGEDWVEHWIAEYSGQRQRLELVEEAAE